MTRDDWEEACPALKAAFLRLLDVSADKLWPPDVLSLLRRDIAEQRAALKKARQQQVDAEGELRFNATVAAKLEAANKHLAKEFDEEKVLPLS